MKLDNIETIELFRLGLKTLMSRYNLDIHEVEYNDLEGRYCGSDTYLKVNGEIWHLETISDMMKSTLNTETRDS